MTIFESYIHDYFFVGDQVFELPIISLREHSFLFPLIVRAVNKTWQDILPSRSGCHKGACDIMMTS